MNIAGLDKAKVLVALYNNSKPSQGNARLFSRLAMPSLSYEDAKRILETGDSFDYLFGRALKVDLSTDILDTRLYNRDNGEGAAECAIASIQD